VGAIAVVYGNNVIKTDTEKCSLDLSATGTGKVSLWNRHVTFTDFSGFSQLLHFTTAFCRTLNFSGSSTESWVRDLLISSKI